MTLAWVLALAGTSANAQEKQDIIVDPCTLPEISYAAKAGEAITPTDVETDGFGGDVYWTFINQGSSCGGATPNFVCAGINVNVPPLDTPVSPTTAAGKVNVTGTGGPSGTPDGRFNLKVQDVADTAKECIRKYLFRITANGGGWGDPHLTTVDGVHYDFQSAGEFTALREDELEIQTRQSPVPTAAVPITNPYTGITHCVATYSAIAARLGSSRVTLQPGPGPEPDSKSMQLRVNGKLVTLGDTPIVLSSGEGGDISVSAGATAANANTDGTIKRLSDGVIEITDARGTQIVVTPAYWESQKVWYLNLNVYQTSAIHGTMGLIAEGSWLPALADGTSLGAKPESDAERYEQLYEKFADSWRVTDATSLFDYEAGTSTATFTLDEWPRNNPQSCAIEGGPTPVQPATVQAAQQACANVADATQKADCVFDVTMTGHTGFAKSYEAMQAVEPRGSGWYSPTIGSELPTPPGKKHWWWWWWILLLILLLVFVARYFMKKSATP